MRMMAASVGNARKPRLNRDDWINAALEAIARGGLAEVAIEPLAARLTVTKGSFYAHFSSRDQLIEAALESWEHSHGGTGLERFSEIKDPAERLREVLLAAVSFSQSHSPSVHVSLFAELGDERVRAAVSRVTDLRVRLLTKTYRELGYSPQRASHRARLAYATYLGLLQMAREAPARRMSKREVANFMAEVNSALLTPPAA
jgi:AcrR family transcriptional regulator